jgi:hypothetical protein
VPIETDAVDLRGGVLGFVAAMFAEFVMLVMRWLFGGIAEMRLDVLARDVGTNL